MTRESTRIKAMPETLAESIAAGEVIERPSSALKELIENSIDAGASEIEVTILKGGKHLLEVADDGHGIHSDDVSLALARHATSKLYQPEDLGHIATFGFRGEALASMAATGELTIETRSNESSAGLGLCCKADGSIEGPYPVGRGIGTTVRLRDIFSKLPARQKFLRSDQTERQRIRDLIRVFMIAHPEIGFRFSSGDRLQWNVAPGTLESRLSFLYSDTIWLPVELEAQRFHLSGIVSHPHTTRSSGNDLNIYVNRRIVKDALLKKAVSTGFERNIPHGKWPIGALFLDVLPEDIDVNVHPAKTEVRFLRPGTMFNEIKQAIRTALTSNLQRPGAAAIPSAPQAISSISSISHTQQAAAPAKMPSPPAISASDTSNLLETREHDADYLSVSPEGKLVQQAHAALLNSDLRPIGSLWERYLLYIERGDLIIVDQHAAHERVRYDSIIAALETEQQTSIQELLVTETFTPEPLEARGFRVGSDWLNKVGFVVEPFGPDHLRVRAVPKWFRGDPLPVVKETLQEIAAFNSGDRLMQEAHKIAASLACKGAVLSGRSVPLVEQEALLRSLLTTAGGDTCPHGRPTFRRMPVTELDQWFGR